MMGWGTIRNVQIVEHLEQLRVLIVMGRGEFEKLEIGGLRRTIGPQEIKGVGDARPKDQQHRQVNLTRGIWHIFKT